MAAVTKKPCFTSLFANALKAGKNGTYSGDANMQHHFHKLLARVAAHAGRKVKPFKVVNMVQLPELKALLVAHFAPVRLRAVLFLVQTHVAWAGGGVVRELVGVGRTRRPRRRTMRTRSRSSKR